MTAPTPHRSSAGDMLFGMGGKLLYAATRVALPPLALAHMGLDDYGLWAACFVLVGYLGMAASGFTLVYLRTTAEHHARGDTAAIGRLLSTGMAAMAALTAALMAGLVWALPSLMALLKVAPAQQPLASLLWLGTAAVFLADMSLGAFANVLHAIGRVRQEQQVWVAAFVLETVLIVGLLLAGWGVRGLLVAFALRYLFSASANAVLACRALPGLHLSWRQFDRRLLPRFFGFGAGMQLSGLIASALHSADRLLAGALIGPQATALVDLASKLPTSAAAIASSASGVAVSAAARHDVQGRGDAVRQVYRDASRITVAGLALILPWMAALADPLTRAWLGAGPTQAALAPLLPWMVLGLHAHMLTGPVNAISRGQGRLGADFSYHGLRAGALAIAVAVAWQAGRQDLPTLVAAMALAQVAAASGFLLAAHARLCGEGRSLASKVGLPTLAAYALASVVGWGLQAALPLPADANRLQALGALMAAAAAWLPLAAWMLGRWLLSPAEVRSLARRLPRPLVWRTA